MKRSLMLISERSKHITEVYNVLCRSKLDVVYAENAYTAKAGLFDFSPAFILLDFDIKGADFCISKPIDTDELLAMIDAVLRRHKTQLTIEYKELTINKSNRKVTMR